MKEYSLTFARSCRMVEILGHLALQSPHITEISCLLKHDLQGLQGH